MAYEGRFDDFDFRWYFAFGMNKQGNALKDYFADIGRPNAYLGNIQMLTEFMALISFFQRFCAYIMPKYSLTMYVSCDTLFHI